MEPLESALANLQALGSDTATGLSLYDKYRDPTVQNAVPPLAAMEEELASADSTRPLYADFLDAWLAYVPHLRQLSESGQLSATDAAQVRRLDARIAEVADDVCRSAAGRESAAAQCHHILERSMKVDLNQLWRQHCAVEPSVVWKDSLLCALGEGSSSAELVSRLRWVPTEQLDYNLLYKMLAALRDIYDEQRGGSVFGLLLPKKMPVINALLEKFERDRVLTWHDLDSISDLLESVSRIPGAEALIDRHLAKYGVAI